MDKEKPSMDFEMLNHFLHKMAERYNAHDFIENDPICIPHAFTKKADIEIAAFLAATLAWGQRKIIISKCKQLMELMDNSPLDFILNHGEKEKKFLLNFKHRTYNSEDLMYFLLFFKQHYSVNESLESAFIPENFNGEVESSLNHFYHYFFSFSHPKRTEKHIASPEKKSACKRLNMFLRWMVRFDQHGVDFGLWKKIRPSNLICPIDVHVNNVARYLGLITRKQTDWNTALELTQALRKFDPEDPVRLDFALFGYGIENKGSF